MNKLALAIGPAPSEQPLDTLIELCTKEIRRCNTLLALPTPTKRRKKPVSLKKKAKGKKLSTMDLEELTALLEATLKEE